MKKVLVPTDFSENAQQALQYAIALANGITADVHVLHSFQLSSASAGRFVNIDDMVQKEREEELKAALDSVRSSVSDAIRLEGGVVEGYAVDSIVEQAAHLHCNYIVMGTHGASGLKKVFMGSTASNVLRNSKIPVLAVPAGTGNFTLKHLMIALDAKEMDAAILEPALALAQKTGASISLLHTTDNQDTDIHPSVRAALDDKGIAYNYLKLHTTESIDDSIQKIAAEKNADMLCVVNRQQSWFSQLFQTSVSQQLAFESKIPLLVLHA